VRDVGIGLTIGGLVLGGVGTVFLMQANSKDDGKSGTAAIVCYAIGGAGLVVGVPMWIFGGAKTGDVATSATLRPYLLVGPHRVGIAGTF
jgi:hypothetical protein